MTKAGWLIALFLSIPTAGRAQTEGAVAVVPEPTIELPPPLARVLADYESAWSRRDARALAALFADDGFVLPNGHPPVRGRAAIERHYAGHGGHLALRAIAFAEGGSVAFILGGYAGERGQPDDGKFTLTLRKDQSGRWLIFSDMDSANARRK
jgi:ketosteroid isomerase-like protein